MGSDPAGRLNGEGCREEDEDQETRDDDQREDPRHAFVSNRYADLTALPADARTPGITRIEAHLWREFLRRSEAAAQPPSHAPRRRGHLRLVPEEAS